MTALLGACSARQCKGNYKAPFSLNTHAPMVNMRDCEGGEAKALQAAHDAELAAVEVGFGRVVALYYRSSASHQI
jgi:hypothetical protein